MSMPTKGLFYKTTLITDLDPATSTVQDEIFGPVLVSLTFRTPEEAIALANNTRYGLGGSVWSDNINLALDAASRIKAGALCVNCHNVFDAAAGFGGVVNNEMDGEAAARSVRLVSVRRRTRLLDQRNGASTHPRVSRDPRLVGQKDIRFPLSTSPRRCTSAASRCVPMARTR